jgi:hypothetical protein
MVKMKVCLHRPLVTPEELPQDLVHPDKDQNEVPEEHRGARRAARSRTRRMPESRSKVGKDGDRRRTGGLLRVPGV